MSFVLARDLALRVNADRLDRSRGKRIFDWSLVVKKGSRSAVLNYHSRQGWNPSAPDDLPPEVERIAVSERTLRRYLIPRNAELFTRGLWLVRVTPFDSTTSETEITRPSRRVAGGLECSIELPADC